MVELKYTGTHQPEGMIIDVDDKRAEELLKSKRYVLRFPKETKMEIKPRVFKSKQIVEVEDDDSE